MSRPRMYDGAQHRFNAHDRRWRLLVESADPRDAQRRRALDWAHAYIRRLRVLEERRRPKLTVIGNMFDLLAQVPQCRKDEP